MRGISFWIFIGFAFLILSFKFCDAATWLDPSLKFRTLETPHFSINYYTELENAAKRLAPIAEEVYDTLTKVFKYKIGMKTQVTLLDITDYGNGFTLVFPYPSVTLYLADLSSNLNPYKYDDYLRYLFLHEYVHALHLDMAEGGVSLFRMIFGRMIFPNALEPWFIIEGLATYMETQYTNAGRGRDPRWEMMMRMDVLEENLKSIDQAAVDTVKWPMGHLRYLYGVKFLEYLSETYGEDKLISLAHVYGDFLFSMGTDGAFVFLYRKNLSMLWDEWLDHLSSKYKIQKSKLGKLTEPKLLTQTGYYNLKPKWSKDSQAIYYIQRDADDYPQIRHMDFSSGKSEKVFEGMVFDEALGLSPDGKYLLFSKADTYKNYYTYKDIYLLDLRTQKLSRLTEGLRASDPSFSPDGAKIVFVKNEKGTKPLSLLERGVTYPLAGEGNYFSPSFSPDGKTIVAAKQMGNGSQRIVLIDDVTRQEALLTVERPSTVEPVSESNPVFSPGGDYVFFDSDRTGIVNLYACHLKSRKLFQVTNVISGAMMPDVSPDGKRIAYVSYSSNGYDVAAMDIDPSEWREIILEPETVPTLSRDPEAYNKNMVIGKVSVPIRSKERINSLNLFAGSQTYEVHDYNPWPTLLPLFWIPDSYYNENGPQTSIYIGGMDPLGQHVYYANLGVDFNNGKPFYMLYYANNQFLPQITVGFSDYSLLYDWSGTSYWEREKTGFVLFSFFDNRVFYEYDKQTFTFGLQNINLSNISSTAGLSPPPSLGNLNAFLLGWRYRSDRAYARSISSEDGMDLRFVAEINSPGLKSDYSFTNYSASSLNYFRGIFKHQVLASKLSGFYSRGDQLAQSNFTWRYLALRGYPSMVLSGNKGLSLSLEYRFPLWYLEKGLLYGVTFFDRVWGDLFFDVGSAGYGTADKMSYKRGIGAGLNLDTSSFFGFYALTLKLVYAKGLDAGGEERAYMTVGL